MRASTLANVILYSPQYISGGQPLQLLRCNKTISLNSTHNSSVSPGMIHLLILILGYFTAPSSACHWTSIVIRNGTQCCSDEAPAPRPPPSSAAGDYGERIASFDENMDGSKPDLKPSRDEDGEETSSSSSSSSSTTTEVMTSKPERTQPVGDCPCGYGVGAEEKVEERDLRDDVLSGERPWLAQISVRKDRGKPVECSGSLLNK